MAKHVRKVYDTFDSRRKQIYADAEDLKMLEDIQNRIKDKNKN